MELTSTATATLIKFRCERKLSWRTHTTLNGQIKVSTPCKIHVEWSPKYTRIRLASDHKTLCNSHCLPTRNVPSPILWMFLSYQKDKYKICVLTQRISGQIQFRKGKVTNQAPVRMISLKYITPSPPSNLKAFLSHLSKNNNLTDLNLVPRKL
jgi:hypothetical protein